MKYIKAIDVWTYGAAIRSGQIRLQKGQWIKCGPDSRPSRFHSVKKNGIIVAFHYPNATKGFMEYQKYS